MTITDDMDCRKCGGTFAVTFARGQDIELRCPHCGAYLRASVLIPPMLALLPLKRWEIDLAEAPYPWAKGQPGYQVAAPIIAPPPASRELSLFDLPVLDSVSVEVAPPAALGR